MYTVVNPSEKASCLKKYTKKQITVIDQEVNADPNKSTTAANTGNYPLLGMDYGTYPRARTFTFGVNITF